MEKNKSRNIYMKFNLNKKIFIQIIILFGIISLFVFSTYSWFSDKANPQIIGSQIKVTVADGLTIKLSPDSPSRTTLSLNQLFDNFDDFVLKQVSSADNINFYRIDFGQGLAIQKPKFVKIDTLLARENMIEYGYIDYDFYLQTEEYAKHVYIHKDSHITGIAANAIRISTSFDNGTTNSNMLFGNQEENGIDKPFTTKAVISEGEFIYNNISPSLLGDQIVRTFDNKNGGRGIYDDDPIDVNKLITTIPSNTQIKMTVRIWLEGGDVDCTNTIASSLLDVYLKFGSANVLLNAPNVTANTSNYTINNLTTNMEWALTNNKTTVWTPVTNTNMSFSGYTTVYVRIAEVLGTSPESYATQVIF
ncbi:MAG: hypothetical protein K0R72_197 [Clostridia bacterium]|jgi:hypothetical protein|nr:hypothetical protein [Clostridia bacterium]